LVTGKITTPSPSTDGSTPNLRQAGSLKKRRGISSNDQTLKLRTNSPPFFKGEYSTKEREGVYCLGIFFLEIRKNRCAKSPDFALDIYQLKVFRKYLLNKGLQDVTLMM